MATRIGSIENSGYGAMVGREPRPPRTGERDFVPVLLGQRVRGEGPAALPAQRRERVAGDAALAGVLYHNDQPQGAGVRQSEPPQDQGPYQIWPEHEKPTDNWL